MFSNIGVPGMIIIVVIALIIFGPSKLPELGKAAGRTLREFKDATKGLMDHDDNSSKTAAKTESKTETNAAVKEETVSKTAVKEETVSKADDAPSK